MNGLDVKSFPLSGRTLFFPQVRRPLYWTTPIIGTTGHSIITNHIKETLTDHQVSSSSVKPQRQADVSKPHNNGKESEE